MAAPDIPATAFGVTAPRRGALCPRWARAVAGMLHRFLEQTLAHPGPSRWT